MLPLSAAVGALGGAQFPLAARICIQEGEKIAGPGGRLYAADLLGACASALCISVLLVPVLGLIHTCLFVAVLKALSLALAACTRLAWPGHGPQNP